MKNLFRSLHFFRPDLVCIIIVQALVFLGIVFNILKPWPLALIVDGVLGTKALPDWMPVGWKNLDQTKQLTALILILLAVHLSHAGISAIQNYMAIGIGLRGLQRVRNDVFAWLQRLSLRFHHGTEAGDIIFRAGTDTCAIPTLLQQGVFSGVSALATLVFMMVVMLRMNWQLTLLALAGAPVLLLCIRCLGRELQSRGLVAQRAESKVYALIHQSISAMPLTQCYTRERQEQKRFGAETRRARDYKMSQHGLEVFYWLIISIVLVLNTALVTWVGARAVLQSQLSLGELLVFLAYLGQMFEPLNQLTSVGATISTANASIQRVFEILDSPDEVKDPPNARAVGPVRNNAHVSNSLNVHGNITYEDVSFSYDGTRPALDCINLMIRAGESAAIIGPSGAGKTTMLNLLPRFFDPGSGAVLLEGSDLRTLRVKDLRSQIALVLQEPIILPTTVAENISYGKLHASMSEIEAAAQAANAHEFIRKLPQGYHTPVGEGGSRLSVGERQRVNLARAFLKDAPILLMDEPTSALDVESEAQVVDSLARLMRGRTTLMVAHRLTTIQQVNTILVLEDGKLKESGSPDDLLQRESYYARVVSGQTQLI